VAPAVFKTVGCNLLQRQVRFLPLPHKFYENFYFTFFCLTCVVKHMENSVHIDIIFNESAFKHGLTEEDIRSSLTTFLLDAALNGSENQFLVIGFDTKGNLIEVMYNIIDENTINIFHAMKCRKEYLKLLEM